MPQRLSAQAQHSQHARRRPALLRALGDADPPEFVHIDGLSLRRVTCFKHDSWAATALYEGGGRRVVCKFNRQQPIFGIPMSWLGWLLARRESRMLAILADEPLVPNPCGPVLIDGRELRTATAHEFVAGEPLRIRRNVNAAFFAEIGLLLERVHDRRIAYVDLHKSENILVGDDGLPHLIDFQISICLPRIPPLGWLLVMLQESDRYHLEKHKIWYAPPGSLGNHDALRRPWWIVAHRMIAIPFRTFRRRLLTWLGVRTGKGMAHSEVAPEIGLRKAA